MKKRLICLLLAVTMLLGAVMVLASCGGGGEEDPPAACTEHVDANKDGKCDECSEVLEVDCECVDEDKDGYCDICGDEYTELVEVIDYPWESQTLLFQFTENDNNLELSSGCHRYLAGDQPESYNAEIDKNVRKRNANATRSTGISVTYDYWPNTDKYKWGECVEQIEATVNSKTIKNAPDVYCNFVYDIVGSAVKGYFANLKGVTRGAGDLKGKNYFLFMESNYDESVDNGGYMNEWMNSVTLSRHKMYVLGSDYFTDMIRAFFIIPVSVKIMQEYGDDVIADYVYEQTGEEYEGGDYDGSGEFDIDDFYAVVTAGMWTYDLMKSFSNAVKKDDGNGATTKCWLGDDRIGFAIADGGVATSGLVYTTSVEIIKKEWNNTKNDYDYYYPKTNDQLTEWSAAAKDLVNAPGVAYVSKPGADDIYNIDQYGGSTSFQAIRYRFSDGAVLFGDIMMVGALEYDAYQKMADDGGFGVVPVPIYDGENGDRYLTQIHNVARPGAIAKNTTKFVECTAYLNYQSTHSTDILNQYYNDELMVNIAGGAAGTVAMLKYVRNNVRTSFDKAMEDAMGIFIGEDAMDRKITYLLSSNQFQLGAEIAGKYAEVLPQKYKENDTEISTDLVKLINWFQEAQD